MTPYEIAVAAVLASVSVMPDHETAMPSHEDAAVMARVVYNEMANKHILCKMMVAQSILNRYAVGDLTIAEVVAQPWQYANFKPRVENKIDKRAMLESAEAVVFTYSGLVEFPEDVFYSVTHFHRGRVKPASWPNTVEPILYACGHTWYRGF